MQMRSRYAPGTCEYGSGYREIRWDVVGCNLRCQFCWSPASRPGCPATDRTAGEVVRQTLTVMPAPSTTFVRFTGGEPTRFSDELAEVLTRFEHARTLGKAPVLIQTNGILIGNGQSSLVDTLRNTGLRVLVEVSFKGTNPEEFAVLTARGRHLFDYQVQGFRRLDEISRTNPNVQAVAVLGIYHSSAQGAARYAFADPRTGAPLFVDPARWDPEFRAVWTTARLKMSPKGMWDSMWERCGPAGSGILRHYPMGIDVGRRGLFPAKPA